MKDRQLISDCYFDFSGKELLDIVKLGQSGSDRKYYRIKENGSSIIAVLNDNRDENLTFIEFTKHFRILNLSVPDILATYPEKDVYFLTDLGDTNLYTWLQEKRKLSGYNDEINSMYLKVLAELVNFQVKAIEGLNLELCYPHRSFDEQSMTWDMNYFKYMFLKLIGVQFNEKRLEKDFSNLLKILLKAGDDYFLYRDFQSANIMIVNNEPWFIDYQGGRKGAPQYDVASLLYDSKAMLPQTARDNLLEYYISILCSTDAYDENTYRELYPVFVIVRLMQALGAYGYRGLFEQKPGFAQSIVPAIKDLSYILNNSWCGENFPELMIIIKDIQNTPKYRSLLNEFEREA